MSTYVSNSAATLVLGISLIAALSSCTRPSEPPEPDEVLLQLVARPSFPVPPETALNADLPAYQDVRSACESIGGFPRSAVDHLVEELFREGSTPVWDDRELIWTHELGGNTWTLTVAPYDSLRFRYQLTEGTLVGSWHIEGWNLPGESSGEILVSNISLTWRQTEVGLLYEERGYAWVTTSLDSLKGGGWLLHRGGLGPLGFPYDNRADWDQLGHGTSDWAGSW